MAKNVFWCICYRKGLNEIVELVVTIMDNSLYEGNVWEESC